PPSPRARPASRVAVSPECACGLEGSARRAQMFGEPHPGRVPSSARAPPAPPVAWLPMNVLRPTKKLPRGPLPVSRVLVRIAPAWPWPPMAPEPPAPPVAWLPVKAQRSMWMEVGPRKGRGVVGEGGGAGRGVGDQRAAAVAVAAAPTDLARAAGGPVVGDGTMAQEERGPAAIKNGTAVAVGILRHINAPDTAGG